MSPEKIRMPAEGGLDEARRKLKEMRRKEPSPELVKIIEEVTHRETDEKREIDSSDIAAKPQNYTKRDIDL